MAVGVSTQSESATVGDLQHMTATGDLDPQRPTNDAGGVTDNHLPRPPHDDADELGVEYGRKCHKGSPTPRTPPQRSGSDSFPEVETGSHYERGLFVV